MCCWQNRSKLSNNTKQFYSKVFYLLNLVNTVIDSWSHTPFALLHFAYFSYFKRLKMTCIEYTSHFSRIWSRFLNTDQHRPNKFCMLLISRCKDQFEKHLFHFSDDVYSLSGFSRKGPCPIFRLSDCPTTFYPPSEFVLKL